MMEAHNRTESHDSLFWAKLSYRSPRPKQPSPPKPTNDTGMYETLKEDSNHDELHFDTDTDADDFDLDCISSKHAYTLLSSFVEQLLRGQILSPDLRPCHHPPTPPASIPGTPDEVRRASMSPRPMTLAHSPTTTKSPSFHSSNTPTQTHTPSPSPPPPHPILPRFPAERKTPIGSPIQPATEPLKPIRPSLSQTPSSETIEQSDLLARKFLSKSAPHISLQDYLARLHQYCPMSVGTFLAAGVYISRLALSTSSHPTPTLTVHPKSAHRLVLAAVRVAMKAHEDMQYPHRRFSKVGGVTEKELGRLEVSLCFLMGFKGRVERWEMEEFVRITRELERSER